MSPADFWNALVLYCLCTDGSVTSYLRTPKHNELVGGVPDSAHQIGLAADVVYDDLTELPESKRLRMAERLGLELIIEGNHDHLQAPRQTL